MRIWYQNYLIYNIKKILLDDFCQSTRVCKCYDSYMDNKIEYIWTCDGID